MRSMLKHTKLHITRPFCNESPCIPGTLIDKGVAVVEHTAHSVYGTEAVRGQVQCIN